MLFSYGKRRRRRRSRSKNTQKKVSFVTKDGKRVSFKVYARKKKRKSNPRARKAMALAIKLAKENGDEGNQSAYLKEAWAIIKNR